MTSPAVVSQVPEHMFLLPSKKVFASETSCCKAGWLAAMWDQVGERFGVPSPTLQLCLQFLRSPQPHGVYKAFDQDLAKPLLPDSMLMPARDQNSSLVFVNL